MNNLALLNQTTQTMSSREIAKICNKEHKHVSRDIQVMFEQLGIDENGYAHFWTHPQNGQIYREFLLDKNLTLTLVAGYSAKLRYLIIQRWQQLESQNTLPNFADPVQAARAWADAMERQQLALAQVAELQPKAAALDAISASSTSLNIRETAKTLGIQEKKFIAWAIKHDWLYRDAKGKLCPIAHRLHNGFIEQRAVTFSKSNGETGVSTQAMFTAKALTHLAKLFAIVKEVA